MMAVTKEIIRPYVSMFRVQFIAQLQYRAAAWAGIATQFFFGFVYVMMFSAFYRDGTAAAPMTLDSLISYQWLKQAFLMLVALWTQDMGLLNEITSGHAAYALCRPVELYALWYARLAAQRVAKCALRFAPVLVAALFIPAPYGLALPPSPLNGVLFAASMLLGLCVAVSISMLVLVTTFATLNSSGPRMVVGVFSDFASGLILPLPMMTDNVRRVLEWLPFRSMADVPFRIYSGDLAGAAAANQMTLQLVWIALLTAAGWLGLNRILRRVVIQGG